jgi:hypothetical protein
MRRNGSRMLFVELAVDEEGGCDEVHGATYVLGDLELKAFRPLLRC